MARRRDFLEEIVDERSEGNPEFTELVEAALRRRQLLRGLAAKREEAWPVADSRCSADGDVAVRRGAPRSRGARREVLDRRAVRGRTRPEGRVARREVAVATPPPERFMLLPSRSTPRSCGTAASAGATSARTSPRPGSTFTQIIPELVTNADAAIAAAGRERGRIQLRIGSADPDFLQAWRAASARSGYPRCAAGGTSSFAPTTARVSMPMSSTSASARSASFQERGSTGSLRPGGPPLGARNPHEQAVSATPRERRQRSLHTHRVVQRP